MKRKKTRISPEVRIIVTATKQGNPEAQYNLGCHYTKGTGIRLSYAMARKCFSRAIAQGHAGAMHKIGVQYESGFGVKINMALAFKWYQKALNAGHSGSASAIKHAISKADIQTTSKPNQLVYVFADGSKVRTNLTYHTTPHKSAKP